MPAPKRGVGRYYIKHGVVDVGSARCDNRLVLRWWVISRVGVGSNDFECLAIFHSGFGGMESL